MLSQFLATHSSIQGALPVLIDAALKGAILVLMAAVAAYLLKNRSAASRHAAWTAAVIGHLAIPALVLLLPAWKMPLLPAASWMQAEAAAPSTASSPGDASGSVDPGKSTTSPAPSPKNTAGNTTSPLGMSEGAVTTGVENGTTPNPHPTTTAGTTRPGIIPIVAAIWLAGALLVLLRLAFGTWRVGQLARDGARVEDGVWLSLTQRLANRLGVTRPLILLRGERLAVPVTWGIVYPAVLLPQDSDSWSEERRRFVLVHEMAHVKRFDALTQLLAQISLAVFWFDPLVWLAAHRMRVEREHACDDYVLRDGTAPSLYAGELLEMVRSIGMPSQDSAAPAFAALAMARRSEFEGRMLAILDPRLDRHTLTRRSTLMTAVIVALLTLPLAALRPFQQPEIATAPTAATAATSLVSDLPASFKISISDAGSPATSTTSATSPAAPISAATAAARKTVAQSAWSCDSYTQSRNSTHINSHIDSDNQILNYMVTTGSRCAEAALVGHAKFSPDETRIAQLSPGGFARFRERTETFDRAVSVTPVGDGSLSYTAMANGRTVPFDETMVAWLSRLLPEILREAAINVPERVARIRARGGVPAVLQEIARIRSTSAKRAHYEELLKAPMSSDDAERVTTQAAQDLVGSSGDLSAVIQQLPRSSMRSPQARQAVAGALSRIQSSGDKTNTLQVLAPNADPEMLLMLAKAAESLPSSGDKANFLISTASEYLTPGNEALRNAFFKTTSTLQSSGDMANVLISAMPYGHASSATTMQVIETSKGLASSGDAMNVLISLVSQRLLQPRSSRETLAVIERTLTMASSGDRANVLISVATNNLLSSTDVRDAYTRAAMALPSEGDRANVLASAARH